MAATAQRPSRWYTWREAAKAEAGILASTTDKDARIDFLISQMSAFIERRTSRKFIPWTGTKEFDYQGTSQLILGDDLLSATAVSKDGTAISSANYFLYPLNAADDGLPYTWLELLFTQEFFQYTDTRQSAVSITGKWGFSELLRSETTLAEDLDTSETGVDLTSGTNIDIGMTLLVDSEQMFVKNISSNTATVQRPMNGTNAATHSNGATVYVVEPDPRIQYVCNILVARGLHRGDAAWSDRAGSTDQGFSYFKSMPAEAADILRELRRMVTPPLRLKASNGE